TYVTDSRCTELLDVPRHFTSLSLSQCTYHRALHSFPTRRSSDLRALISELTVGCESCSRSAACPKCDVLANTENTVNCRRVNLIEEVYYIMSKWVWMSVLVSFNLIKAM